MHYVYLFLSEIKELDGTTCEIFFVVFCIVHFFFDVISLTLNIVDTQRIIYPPQYVVFSPGKCIF